MYTLDTVLQYRPTETIHRESSAFRVRARIFRASCERDGPRIALAIAFRVTRLQVRVTRLQVRVVSICIGGRIIEYRDIVSSVRDRNIGIVKVKTISLL